jgi:hypothetical protein
MGNVPPYPTPGGYGGKGMPLPTYYQRWETGVGSELNRLVIAHCDPLNKDLAPLVV